VTLYARGYRPYVTTDPADRLRAGGLRFGPILAEGRRDARRGRAYRLLGTFVVVVTVIVGFLLYFEARALDFSLVARRAAPRQASSSVMLEGAIAFFQEWSWPIVSLATLFVACGAISDDLRSRALPLYLSRPIRPFDYYLGKLLVPVSILADLVLAPMLAIVLLAVLMRPTEEMLGFLGDQGRLVGAILVFYVAIALSVSSLVLLYSAWTSRRLTAVILGAVTLLGGEVVRNSVRRLDGPAADWLRATSIVADTKVVLFRAMGRDPSLADWAANPPLLTACAALGTIVLLCAWAVLRRARSVEVTA
jgi:hypothetical protein